jgi:hypothetical protein
LPQFVKYWRRDLKSVDGGVGEVLATQQQPFSNIGTYIKNTFGL